MRLAECSPVGENTPHHSYLHWIAHLTIANLLLVALTVAAVRLLPPASNATFLAAGPQCINCWQGISPGKTQILQVSGLLETSGLNFEISPQGVRNAISVEAPHGWLKAFMYPSFAGFRADPRIAMFCLRDDDQTGGLILADVLSELGPPDDTHFQDASIDKLRVYLRYRTRQMEISFLILKDSRRFTLFNAMEAVCYEPLLAYPAPSILDLPWHGATSIYRYYPQLITP